MAKAKEKAREPDIVLSGKLVFKKNDPSGIAFALEDSSELDIANVRMVEVPLPDDFTPEWYDVTGEWSFSVTFTKNKMTGRMSGTDGQVDKTAARKK